MRHPQIRLPINKALEYKFMTNNSLKSPIKELVYVKWEPSDQGYYKLNIDGSC